jgi:hypothetical protein
MSTKKRPTMTKGRIRGAIAETFPARAPVSTKKIRKRIPDEIRSRLYRASKALDRVLSTAKFVSDDLRILPNQLRKLASGQPPRKAFAVPKLESGLPKHWDRYKVYYRMRVADHEKGTLSPRQVRVSIDAAVAAANAVGTARKLSRHSYQKMRESYPRPVLASEFDDFNSDDPKPNALEAFLIKQSRKGLQ